MELRLALTKDLTAVKGMYQKIVAQMNQNENFMWDEYYPCEFLEADIQNREFYILENDAHEPVAAFALKTFSGGADSVKWTKPGACALYLYRLGVHPDYLRKGFGRAALTEAAGRARQLGADYLRLFAVDYNRPAIRLYEKAGFKQAGGFFDEVIDKDLSLRQLGFEIKTAG